MPKRTFLRATQFEPHPADAAAVKQLSNARLCSFGLNPRRRVYGVTGCIADSHVPMLLQLPQLIEVSVSNMGPSPIFTDLGMEELLRSSSMQIFGCAQNQALTDRSAAAVASSSRLRWLCLNNCAITDIGVQHISNHHQLLGLYLADTPITLECVPNLCRLTNLRNLNLLGTAVTESARRKLSVHMPKCRSMRLSADESCGSHPKEMNGL